MSRYHKLTNLSPLVSGIVLSVSLLVGIRAICFASINQPIVWTGNVVEAANVKIFGALGDGVTDDTAAIQAALSSGYSRVYVPGGTYRLNGILRIPSNKRLTLAPEALMLRCANSSSMLLNDSNGLTGGFEANSNIVVEGGVWDANNGAFPLACTVLGFGHVSNVVVRDCSIRNIPSWHGIELNGTRQALVERVSFRNCPNEALQLDTMNSGNPGVFPWFGPYDNTRCEDIVIQDCTFTEVATAVGSHSAPPVDRLVIRRCVANSTSGPAIKPVLYTNWSVEDCEFNDCLNAFAGTASSFVLRGNRIKNSRGAEIDLSGCRDGVVEDNIIVGAKSGIVNVGPDVVLRGNLTDTNARDLAPLILPGLELDSFFYVSEAKADKALAESERTTVTTSFAGRALSMVDIGPGDTAILLVAVAGSSPLRFQWLKDEVPIVGAVQSRFVVSSASIGSAGRYSVKVSNSGGTVFTAAVQLTVAGQSGRQEMDDLVLSNFSIRASVSEAETPLIAGFGIRGSGSKSLVVRAVGPGLAGFGVTDVVADPKLSVFESGGGQIASNDNWPQELATIFDAVGAFPLAKVSADAGLLVTLPSGSATAQAQGLSLGVLLVEFFDLAPGVGPRLVNLSARGLVAGSDRVLIAGFSSMGRGAKRLLIRGVGPRLGLFGVAGFLGDPRIELFDSAGRIVGANDNWDVEMSATFTAAGAFPLEPGSKDAAIVAQVLAGSGYTVVLSGVGSAAGEALVEIYELP